MTVEDRLNSLLLAWQEQQAQGQEPAAADLCRACPELEPELTERIRALGHMMALLRPAGEPAREQAPVACANEATLNEQTAFPRNETDTSCEGASRGPTSSLAPVPGYEILGELGRGGMGVVYKARQVKLNRIVALKMILAGAHAGPEAVARFFQEAETIARLKHPNIVQIYDFGSHEGNAFFSLEFLEGGSLAARLQGAPQPARQVARLVETLARAMHAAHAQGVVHRDLKPANVLLAADGTPKITDFGLARQTDSGMTATGAILGTPSYMAPEQALGQVKEIGPAADVYALGAIVYEMLTGRPPFKGVSAWDTVQMAVGSEPVPPRQLNAQVPRDLETVCLKCLQKEPARRYASAAVLAEDLRRFQAGLPVLARPVGRMDRGWRWCRRNPAVAAISAACLLILVGSLAGMTSLYLHAERQRAQAEGERAQAELERRRAEGERKRADEERKLAENAAVEVKRQQQATETQRRAAQDEAKRAREVTRFLVGMFNASDPLGLNGLTFNLNERAGEKLTARQLLDRGAERIADSKQTSPRVRADILDAVGNVYRSLGRHAEAEPLLTKALALRRAAKALPGEVAASLHSLAWLDHQRGNYSRAVQLYREALTLRLGEGAPDGIALTNTQFNLAWVLSEIEESDEAEKLFLEVIARRKVLFGPDHRETALAKAGLVGLYLDVGRFSAAAPRVNELLATFRKLGANQYLLEGIVKFQQGVLWGNMLGNQVAAEKHFREALALARKGLGPRHQYVTVPLVQLSFTLEKRGNYSEAEELLREAVAIARTKVGAGHPKMLLVVGPLARLLQRRGQGKEGDQLFEELLAAHQKRFGKTDPFVADVFCVYAEHLFAGKDFARQEEKLQAAARIYRAAAGSPRRRFAWCLTCLAATRYRNRDFAASEPYYREALEVARKRPAEKRMIAARLSSLANTLMKQGKFTAEVDRLLTEAEQLLPALNATERQSIAHDVMLGRCLLLRRTTGPR